MQEMEEKRDQAESKVFSKCSLILFPILERSILLHSSGACSHLGIGGGLAEGMMMEKAQFDLVIVSVWVHDSSRCEKAENEMVTAALASTR